MAKYFKDSELTCKCGCGLMLSGEFIQRLDELREACNFPFKIISGARCEAHNRAEKGALDSQHVSSKHKGAADIACTSGDRRFSILRNAAILGFTGLGLHKNFIHVDIRETPPVSWFY